MSELELTSRTISASPLRSLLLLLPGTEIGVGVGERWSYAEGRDRSRGRAGGHSAEDDAPLLPLPAHLSRLLLSLGRTAEALDASLARCTIEGGLSSSSSSSSPHTLYKAYLFHALSCRLLRLYEKLLVALSESTFLPQQRHNSTSTSTTLGRAVGEYLFLAALLQASPSEHADEGEGDQEAMRRRHERPSRSPRTHTRPTQRQRTRLVLTVPSAAELSTSGKILATAIRRHLCYRN